MKKYLILVAVVFVSCLSSFAQSIILNNPDNKTTFGIRLSYDQGCAGKYTVGDVGAKMFKAGEGMELAGLYDIPLVANLYLEAGMTLYYNTYTMKNKYLDALEHELGSVRIFKIKMKKFGVRVPVMAGYHFDIMKNMKLFLCTGPELEIGIYGREQIDGHPLEGNVDIYGSKGNMKRFNLLWGVGGGISFRKFYIMVNGGFGMVNMLKESEAKVHENHFSMGFGLKFNI